MSGAMKPTPEQQAAIEARGQSLLLSAGAGAGKTSTMIERIIGLLLDEHERVSIESLLVVTFTRAATAHMRAKLAAALEKEVARAREALDHERVAWLEDQLALLPRARISTIDSFCNALLQENAEAAGLAPDFELQPEEEARLQRAEWTRAEAELILAEESADGEALGGMLRQLKPGAGIGEVVEQAMKLQSSIEGLDDPARVVDDVFIAPYAQAADPSIGFDDTRFGQLMRALLADIAGDALEPLRAFLGSSIARRAKAPVLVSNLKDLREAVEAAQRLAGKIAPEDELPKWTDVVSLPRAVASNNKALEPGDLDVLEALKQAKKKASSRGKKWEKLLCEKTLADHRRALGELHPTVRVIARRLGLDLVEDFLRRGMESRRLTFAQLERLTQRLLLDADGSATQAAVRLRGQFTHVFVDEFQDVNALQAALLRAVARPGEPGVGGGNLFVVGDVKQSIYGFRHADPGQFLALHKSFLPHDRGGPAHPGARIDLLRNFRSAPPLLDALNAFFHVVFRAEVGGVDYDESHSFIPGKPDAEPGPPRVEVRLLAAGSGPRDPDDDDSEGDGADGAEEPEGKAARDDGQFEDIEEAEAREIVAIIREEQTRGTPLGDIAILLRTARVVAPRVAEALRAAGIPVATDENLGFLLQQEIVDATALLRAIDNPYRDVSLVGALRGPAGRWSEDDLLRLRLVDRRARLHDNLLRASRDTTSPIQRPAHDFLSRLARWRGAARSLPMARLFSLLLDELQLRERVAVLPGGDQRRRNLQYLVDRAVQFDRFRRKGLGEFLRFLDDLLERGEELGKPGAADASNDAVRLMTMHKAKGLEFPVVIVPFLGRKFNLMDLNARVAGLPSQGLATRFVHGARHGEDRKGIGPQLLHFPLRRKMLSEEMRLLYVALTRPEERLYLVASDPKMRERVDDALILADRAPTGVELQSAGRFLDWVLLALRGRDELRRAGNPPESGDLFRVVPPREPGAGDAEQADASEPAIDEHAGQMGALLARVRQLAQRAPDPDLRAKVSVSEAKRAWDQIHSEANPPAPRRVRLAPRKPQPGDEAPEWLPASLAAAAPTGPRGRGVLTHRFLALMDLAQLHAGRAVAEELSRLAEERFFTHEEARLIDVASIEAFLGDPMGGERLLVHHARARREVPFTLGALATDFDPRAPEGARVVIQGIVDAYFVERFPGRGERLVLIDYKTDRWDGTIDGIERLQAAYSTQLRLYCAGLESLLGRPVDEAWLYFLDAGQGFEVEPPRGDAEWRELVAPAVLRQA